MKLTSEEMRTLYQRRSSRSVAGRLDCLSEDIMARAAIGELNQSDREMVADHLTVCSDCAQEYRLLHRMKPLIEQAVVLPPEIDSLIEPVVEKRNAEERVGAPRPGAPRRFIDVFFSGVPAYAVVTVFLVIGLACVVLIISLRRQNADLAAQLKEQRSRLDQASQSAAETNHQLAETTRLAEQRQQEISELRRSLDDLSQPQVNTPITDLDLQYLRSAADRTVTTVDRTVTTVTVPRGGTLFTVILHVDNGPSYSEYALEILDAQGREIRRVKGLYRSQVDTFHIALPRRLLPAGRYRLRLYGLYAGGSKAVGDYQISVRYL